MRLLQNAGFAAAKTSRIGYPGPDLSVPLLGADRRVEVKCRGKGFTELYRWLDGADLLIVRRDRNAPLVVIPLTFRERNHEGNRESAHHPRDRRAGRFTSGKTGELRNASR